MIDKDSTSDIIVTAAEFFVNKSILAQRQIPSATSTSMSRSDIERIEDRRPFYLYVDEFQNFATDSFATILSEARKYALNLTVANQYISQMSETVRDAVFGNVGTMISFRVSADDAPILAKQFEPQFEAGDLLQMHNRNFIINMVIKGEKAPAFNATTLTLPQPQLDNTPAIIENTRRLYSRDRADVEREIAEAIAVPEALLSPKQRHEAQQTATRQPNVIKWPTGIKPVDFSNPKPAEEKRSEYPTPTKEAGTNPKRRRNRQHKPSNPNAINGQFNNQSQDGSKNETPVTRQATVNNVRPNETLVINHNDR